MSAVPPLHQAIQSRDVNAARAALERDASQATTPLPGGLTPLLFALYNGAHEIAELLRSLTQPDVFECAALNDAQGLARYVVEDPAAIRRFSPDGWTALHLAAFFGAREACFVLIGLGASLETVAQNPTANTPLHAAIAGAAGETLAPLLVALGAPVAAPGGEGITPLHLAAVRGFDTLSRLLVARGASSSALTEEGHTPADLAASRGHNALAAWLGHPQA